MTIYKNLSKQFPEDIPQLLDIANQLYRENGPQQIQFKDILFKKGDRLFTDNQYDRLKKKYQTVEQPINAKKRKLMKQPLSFGTLRKHKQSNLYQAIKRYQKQDITDLILTPKYDGIGFRLYCVPQDQYQDYGIIVNNQRQIVLTRYDKEYGLDISFKFVNKLKQELPINTSFRGEIITLINHEGFIDKRSYVSAMINNDQLLPDDCIMQVYEMITNNDQQNYIDMLNNISQYFPSNLYQQINIGQLNHQILCEFKDKIPKEYQSDGIVIRPNDKHVFENVSIPLYQIAYKFESDNYKSIVNNITFRVNNEGFLIPTVHFNTVQIDGKQYNKATGHNFNYLYQYNLLPQQECYITIQIIPIIKSNSNPSISKEEFLNKLINKCPNCQSDLQIIKDSPFYIKCSNYYTSNCCYFNIVEKVKKQLKLTGLGTVKIQKLISSPNFDIEKWILNQGLDPKFFLLNND